VAELVTTGYGKEAVSVYRTDGIRSLFAAEVGMTARSERLIPSYTEGDNTLVVATDSMKNFIHTTALDYDGATLEEFLELVARRFLDAYGHVDRIELRARELPLRRRGEQSFQRLYDDYAVAELALDRDGRFEHRCGREAVHLVKLTGSSFADFLRDRYTTLPEAHDRPLYIHLDLHWVNQDFAKRAPGEEVRDSAATTFAEFESASIQELLHEMGTRLLRDFQELGEISLIGQNRLWDTAQVSATDERVRTYTDPRPPFGRIELTLRR
jgi:urate oxidase / 2-oxo-4-hydroxy-4-carboxy-5-ureidoimidazoline decarboxylase